MSKIKVLEDRITELDFMISSWRQINKKIVKISFCIISKM